MVNESWFAIGYRGFFWTERGYDSQLAGSRAGHDQEGGVLCRWFRSWGRMTNAEPWE